MTYRSVRSAAGIEWSGVEWSGVAWQLTDRGRGGALAAIKLASALTSLGVSSSASGSASVAASTTLRNSTWHDCCSLDASAFPSRGDGVPAMLA